MSRQTAAMDGNPVAPRARLRSIFQRFTRDEWASFRTGVSLAVTDEMLKAHAGLIEPVSKSDVLDIYLPLARLLGLNIEAIGTLHRSIQAGFFGAKAGKRPYVIGIAGSVAVGKSTFARLLQAVLQALPEGLDVALVATDGFLHSTAALQQRNLLRRKGFPESYDLRRMLSFLIALKSGEGNLQVPVYSHHLYDIVPNRYQTVDRPDVVIFEGLNVLQTRSTPVVASDYFDFSIYVDADTADIESWYVERFLVLQRTVFQDPTSYFHHFASLPHDEAVTTARGFWQDINLPNLLQNIEPTRERASMVLRKRASHEVGEVWLRQA
jgi:type I pantothenate kinase